MELVKGKCVQKKQGTRKHTIDCARPRALSKSLYRAALPNFTSNTNAFRPSAPFLDRIDPTYPQAHRGRHLLELHRLYRDTDGLVFENALVCSVVYL